MMIAQDKDIWTKYNFVCNNCDALIEITSKKPMALMPDCLCGSAHDVTWIGSDGLDKLLTP